MAGTGVMIAGSSASGCGETVGAAAPTFFFFFFFFLFADALVSCCGIVGDVGVRFWEGAYGYTTAAVEMFDGLMVLVSSA